MEGSFTLPSSKRTIKPGASVVQKRRRLQADAGDQKENRAAPKLVLPILKQRADIVQTGVNSWTVNQANEHVRHFLCTGTGFEDGHPLILAPYPPFSLQLLRVFLQNEASTDLRCRLLAFAPTTLVHGDPSLARLWRRGIRTYTVTLRTPSEECLTLSAEMPRLATLDLSAMTARQATRSFGDALSSALLGRKHLADLAVPHAHDFSSQHLHRIVNGCRALRNLHLGSNGANARFVQSLRCQKDRPPIELTKLSYSDNFNILEDSVDSLKTIDPMPSERGPSIGGLSSRGRLVNLQALSISDAFVPGFHSLCSNLNVLELRKCLISCRDEDVAACCEGWSVRDLIIVDCRIDECPIAVDALSLAMRAAESLVVADTRLRPASSTTIIGERRERNDQLLCGAALNSVLRGLTQPLKCRSLTLIGPS